MTDLPEGYRLVMHYQPPDKPSGWVPCVQRVSSHPYANRKHRVYHDITTDAALVTCPRCRHFTTVLSGMTIGDPLRPAPDPVAALAGTKELFRKAAASGKEAADAMQAAISAQGSAEEFARWETASTKLATAAFDARMVGIAWEQNRVAAIYLIQQEQLRRESVASGLVPYSTVPDNSR